MDNEEHPGSIMRAFMLNANNVTSDAYENKNLRNAMFKLVDNQSVNEDVYNRIVALAKMTLVVLDKTYQELVDICFAFGGYPNKMTKRELFVDLLHPLSGRLLVYDPKTGLDNCRMFMKKFNEIDDDNMVEINVRKAMAANIITQKESLYMLDGDPLGSNLQEVVYYMVSKPHIYKGKIKAAIEMKGELEDPEDLDTVPTKMARPSEKKKEVKIAVPPAKAGTQKEQTAIEILEEGLDKLLAEYAKTDNNKNIGKEKKAQRLDEIQLRINAKRDQIAALEVDDTDPNEDPNADPTSKQEAGTQAAHAE